MTVKATDADDPTTQNGKIEYKLLNGTDLFQINDEGNNRLIANVCIVTNNEFITVL